MGRHPEETESWREMSNKLANKPVYLSEFTGDSPWMYLWVFLGGGMWKHRLTLACATREPFVCTFGFIFAPFVYVVSGCAWTDALERVHVRRVCGQPGVAYLPPLVYTSKCMFSFVVLRRLLLPPRHCCQGGPGEELRHSCIQNLRGWPRFSGCFYTLGILFIVIALTHHDTHAFSVTKAFCMMLAAPGCDSGVSSTSFFCFLFCFNGTSSSTWEKLSEASQHPTTVVATEGQKKPTTSESQGTPNKNMSSRSIRIQMFCFCFFFKLC